MAKQRTAKIPFTRVVKMGIISNQSRKAKLSTYYNELKSKYPGKEVYISNCGFFAMSSNWSACFGLKADGKVLAYDWSMPFIGINGNKMSYCKGGSSVASFTDAVTAFPPLLENGATSPSFSHCLDNSNRGRTMLGFNDKEVVLSVVADTKGSSDFTLDEEVYYMKRQGCKYAINLDGGGSSQCNFNGTTISSSRKVHNLFYIVAAPASASAPAPVTPPQNTGDASSLYVGQVIKLKNGARYTNGIKIPSWVTNSAIYVRQKKGDNQIVFSTRKTGPITGTVYANQIVGIDKDTKPEVKPAPAPIPDAKPIDPNKRELKIGQEIRLKSGARYTNGGIMPNWVISSKLYVRGFNSNGVIFSTQKTGAITGVVSPEYIK